MKLRRKGTAESASPPRKITPEEEPEGNESESETLDLDSLDRAGLKQLILDRELEIAVNKGMTDDDIRQAISDAIGTEEAEGEEKEEKEEEKSEADSEEGETVELSAMNRNELKAFITEQKLEITVTRAMSDDDIRNAIVKAVGGEEEESEAEEAEESEEKKDEAEAEEPKAKSAPAGKPSTVAAWMKTGNELTHELQNAGKKFAPTFFVPDGESKVVRFRDSQPVCGIYMYSVHDGKRWNKVTQPTEDDLFAQNGRRPGFYLIYELLDREGYKSKKDGKMHTDVPKFWLVSEPVHKQLQYIASKRGKLTDVDFEIHREGFKRPAYTLTEDKSKPALSSAAKSQPMLSKDVAKFFMPPSVSEQRRLLSLTDEADSAASAEQSQE